MGYELRKNNWHIKIDDDAIAWLHCDKADTSTNVLSSSVLEEFKECIKEIEAQNAIGLIILSDKKNGFIAGADVSEFLGMQDEGKTFDYISKCQDSFNQLEALDIPTVCIIHGFCLGGGTELALACKHRVADDDASTSIGLPEVKLGIHPGFGGTVRLPRLIGSIPALNMMLSGRPVSARAAKKMGLVDYAVPKRHLVDAAKSLVLKHQTAIKPGFLHRLADNRMLRPVLAKYLRYQVSKKAQQKHYPAPYACIDLWAKYMDRPEAMMAEEARSVARLLTGSTAQNLIRVFFLQNQLKELGRNSDFKATRVHVIGAGVMGGDIAAWCALRGLNVSLQDQTPERIAPAIGRAYKLFKKKLKQPNLVQAAMDRLMPDHKGDGLPMADVVIEAIFEDLEVKQNLYKEIEPLLKAGALLTTNTSSIPLEELSTVLVNPERLIGLHFFNPVAQMQLVEIVKCEHTDASVIDQASAFTRQIGRLPLIVKSTPGFLVNRILMPYLLEAVTLLEEGVPAEIIDKIAVDFGMPMGPIELSDTVGLDVCLSVAEILTSHLGGRVPDLLRDKVLAGDLGRKTGKGFYQYKHGKAHKVKTKQQQNISPHIQDRLVLRLLNEAMACLREDVVGSADMLDAGIIFGTGFAPFRGGPMHYIQTSKPDTQINMLGQLEKEYGERFQKDDGWLGFEN